MEPPLDNFYLENMSRIQLALIRLQSFLQIGLDPANAQKLNKEKLKSVFNNCVDADPRFPGELRMIDGPCWEFGEGFMAAYQGPELPSILEDGPIPCVTLDVRLKRSDFGLTD